MFKPESEEAAQAAAAFGHSAVAGDDAPRGSSQGSRSSSEKKRASGEPGKGLAAKGKEWLFGKK